MPRHPDDFPERMTKAIAGYNERVSKYEGVLRAINETIEASRSLSLDSATDRRRLFNAMTIAVLQVVP
jgi:hypothetical protein